MRPTTMLYRNLLSMDVEESIRANPIDGVLLLTGCDKTTPGALMGPAASTCRPWWSPAVRSLQASTAAATSAPAPTSTGFHTELRAGTLSEEEFLEAESCMTRSDGHCMTMGTASTMACMVETLGADPAGRGGHSRLRRAPQEPRPPRRQPRRRPCAGGGAAVGHRVAGVAGDAIRVNAAIGGSTNFVVHLWRSPAAWDCRSSSTTSTGSAAACRCWST